jgi:flagellar biosynthesis GTPase FlhF
MRLYPILVGLLWWILGCAGATAGDVLEALLRQDRDVAARISGLEERIRQVQTEAMRQRQALAQWYTREFLHTPPPNFLPGIGFVGGQRALAERQSQDQQALDARYQEALGPLVHEIEGLRRQRQGLQVEIQSARAAEAAFERQQRQALAEQQRAEQQAAYERQQAEQQAAFAQQQAAVAAQQEALRQQQEHAAQRQRDEAARAAAQAREEQAQAAWRERRREGELLAELRPRLAKTAFFFWAGGLLLICVPAYREYVQDRLSEFGSWGFRKQLVLSGLALGLFGWQQAEGLETSSAALVNLAAAAAGAPAAFYLPGVLLLFVQFLHYLLVPHPAERYFRRAVQAREPDLAAAYGVAQEMYDLGDGPFAAWRARNRERRLNAMKAMVDKENAVMDALIQNQRRKAKGPS